MFVLGVYYIIPQRYILYNRCISCFTCQWYVIVDTRIYIYNSKDQYILLTIVIIIIGVSAFFAALGAYYSGLAAIFEEQKVKLPVGKYPWNRRSHKKHHRH